MVTRRRTRRAYGLMANSVNGVLAWIRPVSGLLTNSLSYISDSYLYRNKTSQVLLISCQSDYF